MAQCSSRCWRCPSVRPVSSALRSPQPRRSEGSRNLVCPAQTCRRVRQEPPPLVRCQPVAAPHSETFRPLYPADACSKVGIEQAIVGRLIGKPTHGGESKVDRGWRKMPGLQFIAVPQDHCSSEGQPRLGTVPRDEVFHGRSIRPFRSGRPQTLKNRGLRMIEVG
jgi:hypothetical protein